MKSLAAVLFEAGGRREVVALDVEPPRAGEVLVQMAAGTCTVHTCFFNGRR